MPKRKAKELDSTARAAEPRRSSRRISTVLDEAQPPSETPAKAAPIAKKSTKVPRVSKDEKSMINGKEEEGAESKPKRVSKAIEALSQPKSSSAATGRQYWLMKAEPESRIEKGHDIKFSVDDLAAKTDPEPWDGIRAYPARNNLRAMRKHDLAFFYHSSCKVPAIVGVMEIVTEHSPDSHDPSAPYYDPSSSPENPKWSVVHVSFRQKLTQPITLKELKAWQGEKGHPLENMQMLKLARISVSKVSTEEWNFLVGEMEKRGDVIKQ